MYIQDNRSAAIKRIQSYLYEIQMFEEHSSQVPQDGIFGEETRAAILDFQKHTELNETGIVNYETFQALSDTAKKYKEENERYPFLYSISGFPLQFGGSGADVEALHALLRSLSQYLKDLPPIPRGAYYSHDTEKAIRYMQDVFLLEEDGIVTAALFEMLENELKAKQSFVTSDFKDAV